jgi:hypothetical protein
MLYLDFAINNEDLLSDFEKRLPLFFQKAICFFKKTTGQVLKFNIQNKNVVVLSKINKRVLKKLDKIFRIDVTKTVVLSNTLMQREEFTEFLKERRIKILDGRWLFKFMILEVTDYICSQTKRKMETLEISILSMENNTFVFQTIKRLSSRVKIINIVTKNPEKFGQLSEELYKENGLILNVTNNMKKSVLKSDIIFNLDFNSEEINKLKLPTNAVIVNFEENIKIKQKSFNGINANFFNVNLPIKYKEIYKKLNNFSSSSLYESLIYKKTANQNIWQEIENDNIEILNLEGKTGMIRFKEFENI